MMSRAFWRDALERAVKTGAQTLGSLFVADMTILTIDWPDTLAVTGTAMLLSLVTSIGSAGVGDPGSAAALAGPYGKHAKR